MPPILNLCPRNGHPHTHNRDRSGNQKTFWREGPALQTPSARPHATRDGYPDHRQIGVPVPLDCSPACTIPMTGTKVPRYQRPSNEEKWQAPEGAQHENRDQHASARPGRGDLPNRPPKADAE